MSSICEQGDPYNGRNYHYVIGVFDGIGHVIISAGIFVIRSDSIGQTKVYFYCAPWMVVFESGGLEALHFMTGT